MQINIARLKAQMKAEILSEVREEIQTMKREIESLKIDHIIKEETPVKKTTKKVVKEE